MTVLIFRVSIFCKVKTRCFVLFADKLATKEEHNGCVKNDQLKKFKNKTN